MKFSDEWLREKIQGHDIDSERLSDVVVLSKIIQMDGYVNFKVLKPGFIQLKAYNLEFCK